uniref:Protein SAAL1 n=1 Tax=Anopheles stephensi TaxID=30069 RepID=A0A182XYY7_ANOST
MDNISDAANKTIGSTEKEENPKVPEENNSQGKDSEQIEPNKGCSPPVGEGSRETEPSCSKEPDEEDETMLKEKLQTLKGDRIGETMYSERFVLSTILKLSKQGNRLLEDDEEFEHDLCNLWDMTIEPDVVRFLLEQDVIELFLALAAASEDFRLIEILFGIIGNMCCVEEMHDLFYRQSNLLVSFCDFLSITDAPVLVQLMRTLTTLFDRSDDERYHWFGVMKKVDNLTEKLSLILATSTNRALLEHTAETVGAMINRFTEAEVDYAQLNEFYRLFGKSCLLEGLFEAFKQLFPFPARREAAGDGFDEETLTLKDIKTMRRFLEIHEHFILSSNELYEAYVSEVDQCVHRVLSSFVNECVLFPVTKNHICIFVSISNIYSGIMYHFRAESFVCMVKIYDQLADALKNPPREHAPVSSRSAENGPTAMEECEDAEAEDDGGAFDVETACAEVREAIFFLVGPIDEQIIRAAIRMGQLKESTFEQMCRELRETMDGEPLLYQTCAKLMSAVKEPNEEEADVPMLATNHAAE